MKVWSSESADLSCMIRDLIWAGLISYDGFDSRLHDMPASSLVWHVFDVFFRTRKICTHVAVKKSNNITDSIFMLLFNLVQIPISFIHPAWQQLQCQCRLPHIMAWLQDGFYVFDSFLRPTKWGPPAFRGSHSPCVVCLSTKSWWCGIFQHACMFF